MRYFFARVLTFFCVHLSYGFSPLAVPLPLKSLACASCWSIREVLPYNGNFIDSNSSGIPTTRCGNVLCLHCQWACQMGKMPVCSP